MKNDTPKNEFAIKQYIDKPFQYIKMKILIIGGLHHKNEKALHWMLDECGYEYKFGDMSDNINDYDVIFSPTIPIDTTLYPPNKKFIFGPHFSVFPERKILQINNVNKNCIYIQPSRWVVDLWTNKGVNNIMPIKSFPFAVDTNRFAPYGSNWVEPIPFVYFKHRDPNELYVLHHFLQSKNITNYTLVDYNKGYDENEYITLLQNSKFGIILDGHESQGFAIQEAMSCNVPLLVWNTKYMSQEYGSDYIDLPCTTIPYWDEKCGEYFYTINELENVYCNFMKKLEMNYYSPREYILRNLSVKACANRLKELIEDTSASVSASSSA
jgi:glycosyltransferase involved in cell wall biosynthesis